MRGRSCKRTVVCPLVLLALGSLATVAVANRAAEPGEVQTLKTAILAKDTSSGSSYHVDRARISTTNAGWALVNASVLLGDGSVGEPTRWILGRDTDTWHVITFGTDLGTCKILASLGIPATVVDELGAIPVTYACANPPLPRVACLSAAGPSSNGRTKPRSCNLSLDGTSTPPFAALVRLTNVRWLTWTRTRATGTGQAIPNHAPFDPYPVRVTLSHPEDAFCGPVFTRAQVTSRFGSRPTRPLGGKAC